MARLWPGAWKYEISSVRDGAIQSEQQTFPYGGDFVADRACLQGEEVCMYPGIMATLDGYGGVEAEDSVWEI